MIEIKNLVKQFGKLRAVDDVSLTVPKGNVTIVIGPSGSGKSTVLRCINHLEVPTSGEIWVDGIQLTHDAKNINAVRAEVGMVFQQFNLFPHLTALENIMLAQRVVRKRGEDEAREMAHATTAARGHPGKGQQLPRPALRRAAAARGHCARAGDEPQDHAVRRADQRARPGDDQGSAGRDAGAGQSGMTMVVVTHEMGFARNAADEVVFMDTGSIVEQTTPEEFFTNPKEERARNFPEPDFALVQTIWQHAQLAYNRATFERSSQRRKGRMTRTNHQLLARVSAVIIASTLVAACSTPAAAPAQPAQPQAAATQAPPAHPHPPPRQNSKAVVAHSPSASSKSRRR